MREKYPFNLDNLREYISRCNWKWASSMVDIPHEYIYRGQCGLSDSQFNEIISAQLSQGVYEYYGGRSKRYLHLDGYKYWTMSESYQSNCINRQPIFDQFGKYPTIPKYYGDKIARLISLALGQLKFEELLDVGCGGGELLDYFHVEPSKYYGIDVLASEIKRLKSRIGFARRGCVKAFEECTSTKLKGNGQLVVMTFGVASFVMHEYLEILRNSGSDFFLMFYREGWKPEALSEMFDRGYTEKGILSMFPYAFKSRVGDYLLVSSQSIDWEKCRLELNSKSTLF